MANHTLGLTLSRKAFIFDTGVSFRGLTISQTEKGFNIVLRGLKRDGAPVYAMLSHTDPQEGLQALYKCLTDRQGATWWRHDKFYRNGSG